MTTIKRTSLIVLFLVILFFGSALLSAAYEAVTRGSEEISRRATTTLGVPIPPVPMKKGASAFHMDARVEAWGALTITETLSMPQLEEELPGGGGYTRTVSKRPIESTMEMMDAPSHEFSLDIMGATCDGEVVPHHLHDEKDYVQICVDPPAGKDPKAPHVYTVQYRTTRGTYFQFWSRFNKVAYNPLENNYGIPIEEVSARITFPEEVQVASKRLYAWTGRYPYRRERAPDYWRGSTGEHESNLEAPNIASWRCTAPFYDSETLMVWVYFPRGSVNRPLNGGVLMDFFSGLVPLFCLLFFVGAMIYCVIRYGPGTAEPEVDSVSDTVPEGESMEATEDAEAIQVIALPVESKAATPPLPSRRRVMLLRIVSASIMFFGGLVIYGLLILPLLDWHTAKSWVETPCKIVKLGSVFRYDYTWKETAYSSDQYDMGTFGLTASWEFQRIKKETPIGSETVCYVNPEAPSQAVMSHKLRGAGYFTGFCMGAFIIIVGWAILPATKGVRENS